MANEPSMRAKADKPCHRTYGINGYYAFVVINDVVCCPVCKHPVMEHDNEA